MTAIKKLGKKLEGMVRVARLAPRLFFQYGTLSPDHVVLPHAVSPIHFNPVDARAKKKFIYDAVRRRYPVNRRFWIDFISAINPDVALDIGVNYGECLFSTVFADTTQALGFEANPALFPYLEKSLDEHPSKKNITLINALVGENPAGEVDFYINQEWSGGSTAIAEIAAQAHSKRKIRMPTISVDEALAQRELRPGSLVFKLDVEGFEPFVILGMGQCLDQADTVIGFIELDAGFVERAGWTLARYEALLKRHFMLYAPVEKGGHHYQKIDSLVQYCDQNDRTRRHFDLMVFKHGMTLDGLPVDWTFNA